MNGAKKLAKKNREQRDENGREGTAGVLIFETITPLNTTASSLSSLSRNNKDTTVSYVHQDVKYCSLHVGLGAEVRA